MKKNKWYVIILILLAFLLPIVVFSELPAQMPMHWGVNGKVDSYGSKGFAAFFPPVLMVVLWLMMTYLPKIDPKKANYIKFEKAYVIVVDAIITFLFVLHISVILISLGYNISVEKIVTFCISLLFIIVGNYLPKAKPNFFFGIRTPWTLSSESCWVKTHRLGGRVFVICGFVSLLTTLFLSNEVHFVVFFIILLIMVIAPMVMSYVYYKKSSRE